LTVAEVAQLCVGLATLLSAIASVILAVRGHELAVRTHTLVNGQSDTIQALREAKGHAEGLIEGEQLRATGQAGPAVERND
jgi:hypothetical protein